jgi:hypothetical protein
MGMHSKCGAALEIEGQPTLICWRSPGHTSSNVDYRRRHYDPDKDRSWDSENVYDEDGEVILAGRPRILETEGRSA